MAQFIYRIEPTRTDMLAGGPTQREAEVVAQHFDYLKKLTVAGQVIMAGRTLRTNKRAFGVVVFHAESPAAARALIANDPAVQHGVMRAELHPFHVALWSNEGPQDEADNA